MKTKQPRKQLRTLQTLPAASLAQATGGGIRMEEYGVGYGAGNFSLAAGLSGLLSPQWGGFTTK
jgi:hypothetical protein